MSDVAPSAESDAPEHTPGWPCGKRIVCPACAARRAPNSAESGPSPGKPQGGMRSEMGKSAYWRMNYESAIQALADLIAENSENVEFARDFYSHNADLLSDFWRAEFTRVFPPAASDA